MNSLLVEAMRNRNIIEFDYHGHHRVAEPHVYGLMTGTEQLRIYQIGGTSSSGCIPDWRNVRVEEIANLIVNPNTFPGARLSHSQRHGKWEAVYSCVEQ